MKKKIVLFLFIIGNCFLISAQPITPEIKTMLNNNGILLNEQAIVIRLNANDCTTCMINLTHILEDAQKKKTKNIWLLINGIANSEKEYYLKNKLSMPFPVNHVIIDDKLFSTLDKSPISSIYIIKDNEINYKEYIKNVDMAGLSMFLHNNVEVTKKDSVEIRSSVPLSGTAYSFIDSNRFIGFNYKYQNVSLFDSRSGENIKNLTIPDLKLNIDSLLTAYLINDTASLNYTLSEIHKKENYFTLNHFPQVEISQTSVSNKKILVSLFLNYFTHYTAGKDTIVSLLKFPVTIITDANLSPIELLSYNFYSLPKNYWYGNYFNMYIDSKSNSFYKRLFHEPDSPKHTNCLYSYTKKGNQLYCDSAVLTLPSFFVKKKLFVNLSAGSFYESDNNLYYYFEFVPIIYNITQKGMFMMADKNYEKSKISLSKMQFDFKFRFLDFSISPAKNFACTYLEDEKKVFIQLINTNDGYVSKVYFTDAPVNKAQVLGSNIYVIKDIADKSYLYKYTYSE